MDLSSRRENLKEKLDTGETVVIFPGPNMKYLTCINVEPSERHFFLFVSKQQEFFFAPELYEQEVKDAGVESFFWSDDEDPLEALQSVIEEKSLEAEKILVDDRMWSKFNQDLRSIFSQTDFDLANKVMRPLRAVKDDAEIRNIREASRIADEAVEHVREFGEGIVGMTEKELARRITDKLEEYGGEGESFPTIVAAGENGAKPHHEPTDKRIDSGEPVVLDFGCWKSGYPSDQTRTLVFGGEPSEKFREVFEAVRKAHAEAIEKVEPGVMTGEVDRAARSVIEDAGYGEEFVHRTGHGVGVEIHEHPKLPEIGEQIELREGMVFSVEPGIYIEGEFGVRIEDLVVVTEDGCERLNRTSRSFEL